MSDELQRLMDELYARGQENQNPRGVMQGIRAFKAPEEGPVTHAAPPCSYFCTQCGFRLGATPTVAEEWKP